MTSPERTPRASTFDEPRRREDRRLLTGAGRYVADVRLPGALEGVVVRSPYAHARVLEVDTADARALPGVIVWTAADLEDVERRMPMIIPDAKIAHPRTPTVLAEGVVRYVGEPVAFVLADDRYVAEDAAQLVKVRYEPLTPVSGLRIALNPTAARVHSEAVGNIAARDVMTFGDVDAAVARAALVVRERFELSRGSAQSLEPRGTAARYDAALNELTVWDATQAPVQLRNFLAQLFGMPEERVRVIAGDVGGGFGPKMALYAEEILVPYAARRLGRPVRWMELRRESFLATTSEREQIHDVAAAVDPEGRLLGLRDHFSYETGAYISYGLNIPFVTTVHLLGLYKIPNVDVRFEAVFTNRMFVSPYRGAGRPYAAFVIERVMDRIAEELGLDPAEVRRRNLIRPEDMPYRYPVRYWDGGPVEYDSGDYVGLLDEVLRRLNYAVVRREQTAARATGRHTERHIGIGIACYAEATGIGPYEGVRVRVERDGRVTVATAVGSQGQGLETTLAQIVARRLAVDVEQVHVSIGDSAAFGRGIGTFASRSAVIAGNAAAVAAAEVAEGAQWWGARALEAAPADVELAGGAVQVRGVPARRIPLAALAALADPSRGRILMEPSRFRPGLEAEAFFNPSQATMAAGVHACVVEVDVETGWTRVVTYVAVHDCGRVLSQTIVDGQVLGGIAQGIGGALYERLVYDDAGQVLTGSYMEYALLRAADMPPVTLAHRETPSPHNPLGVKGVGEAGTIPGHAVIASAVEDALRPLGVRIRAMPLTSAELRALIEEARKGELG